MYPSTVIDNFLNPRNAGSLEHPDGTGMAETSDGCVVRFDVKLDEHGCITDMRFKSTTCVVLVAACSVLSTRVLGPVTAESMRITAEDLASALKGVPAARRERCEVAIAAMRRAVSSAERRRAQRVPVAGVETVSKRTKEVPA